MVKIRELSRKRARKQKICNKNWSFPLICSCKFEKSKYIISKINAMLLLRQNV
jgi:hypothetical protein